MIERKFVVKNSAKRKVLEHLKTYGVITRDIARFLYKTDSLSQIINELNNEGENIQVRSRTCLSYRNDGREVKINEYYLPFVSKVNETKKFIIYKTNSNEPKVFPGNINTLKKSFIIPNEIYDENNKKWKVNFTYQAGNKITAVAHRWFMKRIFTIVEWYTVEITEKGELKIQS